MSRPLLSLKIHVKLYSFCALCLQVLQTANASWDTSLPPLPLMTPIHLTASNTISFERHSLNSSLIPPLYHTITWYPVSSLPALFEVSDSSWICRICSISPLGCGLHGDLSLHVPISGSIKSQSPKLSQMAASAGFTVCLGIVFTQILVLEDSSVFKKTVFFNAGNETFLYVRRFMRQHPQD